MLPAGGHDDNLDIEAQLMNMVSWSLKKAVFANHVAKVVGAPKILGAYNFCLSSRFSRLPSILDRHRPIPATQFANTALIKQGDQIVPFIEVSFWE